MTTLADSSRRSFDRLARPSNRLGVAAALLVLATGAFLVYRALPVFAAAATGRGIAPDADTSANSVKLYETALSHDVEQIDGRSFFFTPIAPPPPHVDPPPPPPADDRPPPPPPPPSTYGGPKVIGTAFDTVWFDGGKTMRVGGALENDMRVISNTTAPYVVRIEWKGIEFDVPFLPHDGAIMAKGPLLPDPPAPTPTAAPPKPGDPKPAEAKPGEPKPAEPKPGEAKPDAPKDDKKDEKKDDSKPKDPPPAPAPPKDKPD